MEEDTQRLRLLHGVSAVQKGWPWFPQQLLTDDALLDVLEDAGFNVVRLGFMWTGANPAAGVFNATYFEMVDRIVDRLAQRGIYTYLDVHQDLMSSLFCLYDGFPRWVVDRRSPPRHAFPWPLAGDCSRFWMDNAFGEALGQAYQDFYDNHNGMRDVFVTFWERAAQHFQNRSEIMGYELINEPWAGDVYKAPELFLPGMAGQRNLQPLYTALGEAIRRIDQRHIILMEPVTWGMVFEGRYVGTGLSSPPGGPAYVNRTVLSYHWYCPIYKDKVRVISTAVGHSLYFSLHSLSSSTLIPNLYSPSRTRFQTSSATILQRRR